VHHKGVVVGQIIRWCRMCSFDSISSQKNWKPVFRNNMNCSILSVF